MKLLNKLFGRNKPLPAPDRSVSPRNWRYHVANWTPAVARGWRS